jgi:hypothetical protein
MIIKRSNALYPWQALVWNSQIRFDSKFNSYYIRRRFPYYFSYKTMLDFPEVPFNQNKV